MIFRQVVHDDLGCASYLIGDEHVGLAAVVDPKLEIDEYLHLARYLGVSIEHILETHNHADHVSGHGRLAAATGATIHIHREAEPDYEHEPFEDGWELELGAVTVRAIHTPGHRPEHTAFALIDTDRGPEPWALLSGDSLFVGDIARPDLAVEPDEGAREIFRSLHERLLRLPASVEVWPGAPRRLALRRARDGPQGVLDDRLRARAQRAAGGGRRGPLRCALLASLGPQPPNFHAIVALNRGPLEKQVADVHPLTPRQVEQKRADGGAGGRRPHRSAVRRGPHPRRRCVTALRAGFGSKLAWLADREREVLLVGPRRRRRPCRRRAGRRGRASRRWGATWRAA